MSISIMLELFKCDGKYLEPTEVFKGHNMVQIKLKRSR